MPPLVETGLTDLRDTGGGGQEGHVPPQVLGFQLTLLGPRGQIMPTILLLAPPSFWTMRRLWKIIFYQFDIDPFFRPSNLICLICFNAYLIKSCRYFILRAGLHLGFVMRSSIAKVGQASEKEKSQAGRRKSDAWFFS